MNLLIISDTPLYRQGPDGPLEVFEPTLREIECLSHLFHKVEWLGYNFGKMNPGHARKPLFDNIVLRELPAAVGGKGLLSKLKVIPLLPRLIVDLYAAIRSSDVVHTRGPSVPAFIGILLSFVLKRKVFWHKYAGNWMEPAPPFMYSLQKKLLIKAKHTHVSINGRWPSQPSHIISLENPCFTEMEWTKAQGIGKNKSFSDALVLCFSGLVSESKGVPQMMRSLQKLRSMNGKIGKLLVAGTGPAMETAMSIANTLSFPVEFTGYLTRDRLNEVYKQSHILILPSRSEGFPKVVAEAASFGCIPVVTNVSALSQYVRHGVSGFLLENNEEVTIVTVLNDALARADLKSISEQAIMMSERFTYERFNGAIQNRVLADV